MLSITIQLYADIFELTIAQYKHKQTNRQLLLLLFVCSFYPSV